MMLPLKMGAFAVVFLGTGGAGIWVMVYLGMPDWAPLSLDNEFKDTYKNGNYGETYGDFLVGVAADNNKEKNNLAWWGWSYKNRYFPDKDNAKGTFSGDTINDEEKLREECKKAYQATTDKIKSSDGSINTGEWHKENVWRYCSPYPSSPTSVEEESNSTTTYTSVNFVNDKKSKFASTAEGKNDWFWTLRASAFFLNATDPSNSANTNFKDLYSSTKNNPNEWVKKLKESCGKLYKESTSNVTSYKDDIYKYCSFKGKE